MLEIFMLVYLMLMMIMIMMMIVIFTVLSSGLPCGNANPSFHLLAK